MLSGVTDHLSKRTMNDFGFVEMGKGLDVVFQPAPFVRRHLVMIDDDIFGHSRGVGQNCYLFVAEMIEGAFIHASSIL